MRRNQRIIVDSYSSRDNTSIHEEFYDNDDEFVSFISNYTGDRNRQRFIEDRDSIERILHNQFTILRIKKVYANGNTELLYDYLNSNRSLPAPRRSRTQ